MEKKDSWIEELREIVGAKAADDEETLTGLDDVEKWEYLGIEHLMMLQDI